MSEQRLRQNARQALLAAVPRPRADQAGQLPRKAQRVLDAELARLPASARLALACRKGCDLCCHLRVAATAAEVFALLDYLRQTVPASEWPALAADINERAGQIHALSPGQLLRTNLPCPLLVDGACRAYPARPLNCRAYHSLDYQACLDSFRNPAELDRGHPQGAALARVHEGVQEGLSDLLQAGGNDPGRYELVTALAEALVDDEARNRLLAGSRPVFERALPL